MTQETGETRDAIIEDDEKLIQKILEANKNRQDPYWVVLFAKPSKRAIDGKHALIKHIKAYGQKPKAQVGMCVAEVCNKTGTMKWDVNMPQRPFDFEALKALGAQPSDEVVVETTSIPGAYLTQ